MISILALHASIATDTFNRFLLRCGSDSLGKFFRIAFNLFYQVLHYFLRIWTPMLLLQKQILYSGFSSRLCFYARWVFRNVTTLLDYNWRWGLDWFGFWDVIQLLTIWHIDDTISDTVAICDRLFDWHSLSWYDLGGCFDRFQLAHFTLTAFNNKARWRFSYVF